MNIFLDRYSLIKLYHKENETQKVITFLVQNKVKNIFLSSLAKVEFSSAFWKKCRIKEMTESETETSIQIFQRDIEKYIFIEVDDTMIDQAIRLMDNYGKAGLRTLDAIQLSTALYLKNQVNLFMTSDALLKSFFERENLPIL